MRPIHRLALGYAALAMAPYFHKQDEQIAEKLVETAAPEPLTTPDGFRKEHQGLRQRARHRKQQERIAAKAAAKLAKATP